VTEYLHSQLIHTTVTNVKRLSISFSDERKLLVNWTQTKSSTSFNWLG